MNSDTLLSPFGLILKVDKTKRKVDMTKCGLTCDYEPTSGGYTPHPWCDTCEDLALKRRKLAELAKRERQDRKSVV